MDILNTGLTREASDRPGDDPIFALDGEARRRAAAGEHIVNATLGALHDESGALSTLPTVVDLLAHAPSACYGYAPIVGSAEFLEGVRRDAFGAGALFDSSIAVATPGGTGACYAAVVNFLERGQNLLTTDLYWSPYGILAQHAGRGVETFAMFDAEGGFNTPALAEAIDGQLAQQGRCLLFLNTPCHNPTGYTLDDAEWGRLVEVLLAAAAKGPVTLLLDHAYAAFAPESAAAWVPHVERLLGKLSVLLAWTASKSLALYGGRVGALIAAHSGAEERRRLFNALGYTCRGTWSNGNHLGQWAVGRVLNDERLRSQVAAERAELFGPLDARVVAFNAAAQQFGLETPRYEGGFFVCAFTGAAKEAAALAREQGVFVVPLQGALRLALCSTKLEDVPRLVEVVAGALTAVASGAAR